MDGLAYRSISGKNDSFHVIEKAVVAVHKHNPIPIGGAISGGKIPMQKTWK